jgi:hypothetical protein
MPAGRTNAPYLAAEHSDCSAHPGCSSPFGRASAGKPSILQPAGLPPEQLGLRMKEQGIKPVFVIQVLRLLLEAEGKVVTREQLRAALWPEYTFVDFEAAAGARGLGRTSQVCRNPAQVLLPLHRPRGMGGRCEW